MNSLWRPSTEVEFLDVGHGFYVAKFQGKEDATKALSGDPTPWRVHS
ncbi:hypothetical protein LINGRAHAP2_LOCUS25213 [Linum grandiflorum]